MKEILKDLFAKIDVLQTMVAVTIMGVFVMISYALVYINIPEGNKESLLHTLGIIEGAVMAIVGFYYGSSKGSQKKTDLIDKITDVKP